MKDKFFKVAKVASRNCHTVAALSKNNHNKHILKYSNSIIKSLYKIQNLYELPPEMQNAKEIKAVTESIVHLKNAIDSSYEYLLQELEKNVKEGETHLTWENLAPSKALHAFERGFHIAQHIVDSYSQELLDHENKIAIAKAYASYANVLQKFEPSQIETRKMLVEKALELDPKNQIATELAFDMKFYDIVPEPPANKL